MVKKLRPRLTYANVVSSLCLFIVLSGGTAYATHLVVNGTDVVDDSLTGADIKGKAATSTTPAVAGTLTGADVMDTSLTWQDLAPSTLGGSRILDNSLTGLDINESRLGTVPTADTVDGLDSATLIGPRAYGVVTRSCAATSPFACTVNSNKGVSAVTRPSTGFYCVAVPGVDPLNTPLVATVDWPSTAGPVGNASAMHMRGAGLCPSGQFIVVTERQRVDLGPPAHLVSEYQDDVGFTFIVP